MRPILVVVPVHCHYSIRRPPARIRVSVRRARAGYSANRATVTGSELVRKRNVADAIASALDELAELAQVNAADIERVAWAIACDESVNPGARVSALVLLSKRTGGFVDRKKIEHTGEVTIVRNTPDLR